MAEGGDSGPRRAELSQQSTASTCLWLPLHQLALAKPSVHGRRCSRLVSPLLDRCLNRSIAVVLLTYIRRLPLHKFRQLQLQQHSSFFPNSDVKILELQFFLQSYLSLRHNFFRQNFKNQNSIFRRNKNATK